MKKKAFAELLEGVSQLGAALRGDKRVISRVDRIAPNSLTAVRAGRPQGVTALFVDSCEAKQRKAEGGR